MKPRRGRAKYLAAALLPILLALVFPVSLKAQESRGTITGKVLDPNKAAVPGAAVKITDVARGTSISLTTSDDGTFTAPYLLSGAYQVVVEVAGFKKAIQDKVIVEINQIHDLTIDMEVGGSQETVTVTSDAAVLNTGDANLGQTVDQKRLAELPLVHGDPYTLIGLTPGATYTGSTKLDRPFEPTHIVGYAVDGTRGNRMDLLIDGAPSTATANANEVIASYVPPSDIVQEFKVQTATFDAQFGNTEGSVTSIVIKSGTNQFHGTAYRWTEPGGVSANDFFGNATNTGRPFTYSNRPGFSVNGPVIIPKVYNGKDKTFFLFGFEAIRDSRPRFDASRSSWVPTAALASGDFSGQNVTIFDPLTSVPGTGTGAGGNGCAVGSFCHTAFAGNKIPTQRINSVAKNILAAMGSPKQPGLVANIVDTQLTETTKYYNNYTFRIDQNIGNTDRMFVRGSWYGREGNYDRYTNSPYAGTRFRFISRQGVVDDVHTFSPTLILNVRYGYNRFIRASGEQADAIGTDLAALGFNSAFAGLVPTADRRFPRFDFPSNTVLSNGLTDEFRPVDSHSVSAVLNKSLNRHSLKFGSEMRIYREDDNFHSNDQTGQFVFDNTYTRQSSTTGSDASGLQALAAFMLGYASTTNIVRRADYSEYSKTWGFFAQDDFRVGNKLTLNLGLRYEFENPMVERQNKSVSGFDFSYVQPDQAAVQAKYAALNDPALKALLPTINLNGGLLFAGKDTGSGLYHTPKNNFLPRLGFAYQWNDKTVIRGGFGIFAGFLGERRGDVIQPGYTQTTTASLAPALPSGQQIPYTLDQAFTNTTILEPVGNTLGRQTGLGQAISFFNQNPKTPRQTRFQIGIQRELPGGWVIEAEYVGNRGTNLEIVRNINALPDQYLNTDSSRSAAQNSNSSFLTGTVANPFAGLATFKGTSFVNATIARSQLLKPFPEYGDVLTTNNDGKSWYNAGQFSLQKRFSKGYTVSASYTWSKWMQATEYLNAADPMPTKMIADQDATNRIGVSAMYELPFGKNQRFFSSANWVTNAIVGGWQLGGTWQNQTGFPVAFGAYNITSAATSGDFFYRGGDPNGSKTVEQWFNTGNFVSFYDWPTFLPTGVTAGTATTAQITAAQTAAVTAASPVNHLRTIPFRFSNVRRDKINNVDLTLKKDIQLKESMKLQFRFEALNAFNHPYFLAPISQPTLNNFGIVNGQDNYSRRIQIGMKFIF